ncbi:MAG: efflux RND transporter periplasmic adaptor subunit [Acidobacteria bacterium]|nr:efflux RND transporter periplasmic adaptor subunit [Acidobacteriota bacterium]
MRRKLPSLCGGRQAFVYVCVALLAIGALACSSAAPAPDPPPASSAQATGQTDVATVYRGPLRPILLLTGELRAVHGVKIVVPQSPQRDATVRWMVEEGTYVEEGDQMVELDTSQIATQLDDRQIELEEAINELNGKAAEVAGEIAQKEFDVEQARINVRKAEIDAGVPEDLQSQREFQERQLALEEARNAFDKVETEFSSLVAGSAAELDVLRIEVQKEERDVAKVQRALETMVLRAPRAGIAVAGDNRREGRKFLVGDRTWVGAEVMAIPDLSVMMVDTRMSDVDDGKVTPGMSVVCTLDAYPDRQIAGYVRSITPMAQWVNMRSEQRFFRLVVDLESSDPELMRPGMSVKVEVVTGSRDDELLVPRAALEFGDEDVFAVLENGERRLIELGPCSAHECSVVFGLAEGTRVRVARSGR